MKKIIVEVNLTDKEFAVIEWYGFKPEDYVTSIVHYDLRKIAPMEVCDSFGEDYNEITPDVHRM